MDLGVSAEHSPMSGIDEYLVHNYPHPVRVMWTSDPRAYERLWFTAQDKVGEVFFVCGLGFYPNLGAAEAYALVNHNGVHRSVHAHRKMGDDRTNMKIGPFDFQIVEPFKQWHISLADNEFGLKYGVPATRRGDDPQRPRRWAHRRLRVLRRAERHHHC
jgi:hypothetical protein